MADMHRKAYENIHHWLRYNFGSASRCDVVGCEATKFEWALKKGARHAKDRSHYKQLCLSHHREYDRTSDKALIDSRYRARSSFKRIPKEPSVSVRIYTSTHKRLKVLSAEAGMNMIDYIDLVILESR